MSQQRQPGKGGSGDQQKAPAAAGAKAAPRTATGSIPVQGGGPAKEGLSDYSIDASQILTAHQKSQLGSGFVDNAAERRRSSLLAVTTPSAPSLRNDAAPQASPSLTFDGTDAPPQLKNRDVWKAVQAPLQSAPGKRSRKLYENVLRQFALATNPRYDDDAPGKIRGHIYVWDVSRAMGCEIPHFVGAKELTLAQTCDWLRHEGPMRGWKRVSDVEIYERANAGHLVIALPRDARTKHIAIVSPQEAPADNSPRLEGVCLRRGHGVHPRDMFGSKPVDCFWHD